MHILECYAVLNPDIEYRSGIIFLVGFLYLTCKEESLAFNILTNLLAKTGLQNCYKKNVQLQKMPFYQMNRLLAIYHPRLHKHLFEEGINVTYYVSPWFLTVFTCSLQYVNYRVFPAILDRFFTEFLMV